MNRKPTSPGEILYEEFLVPLDMSEEDLALHIGCDDKTIKRIISNEASITPEVAIKLALAFDTSPEFWLNAQMAVDLWGLKA